jgi:hypothetical protein
MPDSTGGEELREIVEKTFPLVVSALLSQYQLPRDDATRLQQELFEWFDRLCRRPGTPSSVSTLRLQLISMTCKVGHIYWVGRLGAELPKNETLKRALALGPDIIAFELEERIKRPTAEGD